MDRLDIQRRLTVLYAEQPKHWQFALRRDLALRSAVEAATPDMAEVASLPERAYAASTGTRPICPRGQRRPLKSFGAGWGYCGKTSFCACAREGVSASVRASKAATDTQERARAAQKRAATNLARYGVENAGQTATARQAHSAVYADSDRVVSATQKGAATMLARYGVDNALKLPKVSTIRSTIAANLSPEQRAAKSAKQRATAKAGALLRHSYRKLRSDISALGFEWLCDESDYRGVMDTREFRFVCGRCNVQFNDWLADGHRPTCPECDKAPVSYISDEEDALAAFIEGLGMRVRRTVRDLVARREIDILVPDAALAVEYCGLYWHAEFSRGRGRDYHRHKMEECERAGVRLVTIFADEWNTRREAVQMRLRHLLGRTERRIVARKTICEPITAKESAGFLDRYHVQGDAIAAKLRYGLRHEGRLVAVMTFGRPRLGRGQTALAEWEMYRFACADGVTGGASKMFSRFRRDHSPNSVLTYADLRWGHGDVYTKMGFRLDGRSAPGYWWMLKYAARLPRQNFTKASLAAQGFTEGSETEIMRKRGYDRIWDCGSARFIWKETTE